MKGILFALFAVFFILSSLSSAGGQTAAPSKAEQSANVKKAPRNLSATGIVSAYDAGKIIKVKGPKDKERAFEITGDTKVKGDIKKGALVLVMYRKEGDKWVANSISVTSSGGENKGAPTGKAWPGKARLDELNRPEESHSSDGDRD